MLPATIAICRKLCSLQAKQKRCSDLKYGTRHFWSRGYYVDTVGKNKKIISEYIRNQLEEDYASDQISMKEFTDPFTGSKNK